MICKFNAPLWTQAGGAPSYSAHKLHTYPLQLSFSAFSIYDRLVYENFHSFASC